MSTSRSLRQLSLEGVSLQQDFTLPNSLEAFICSNAELYAPFPVPSYAPSPPASDHVADDYTTLSNLKVLELDTVPCPLSLIQTITRPPTTTLTRLHLLDCETERYDLTALLESGTLSELTDFCISESDVDDVIMLQIASKCPRLEHVDLRGCYITGVAVKELCSLTTMKTLKMSDCYKVSADAIEWARAKGVTVTLPRQDERMLLSARG
jgi:hypothetical protein